MFHQGSSSRYAGQTTYSIRFCHSLPRQDDASSKISPPANALNAIHLCGLGELSSSPSTAQASRSSILALLPEPRDRGAGIAIAILWGYGTVSLAFYPSSLRRKHNIPVIILQQLLQQTMQSLPLQLTDAEPLQATFTPLEHETERVSRLWATFSGKVMGKVGSRWEGVGLSDWAGRNWSG